MDYNVENICIAGSRERPDDVVKILEYYGGIKNNMISYKLINAIYYIGPDKNIRVATTSDDKIKIKGTHKQHMLPSEDEMKNFELKRFYIYGHETRGDEVLKLLKENGGLIDEDEVTSEYLLDESDFYDSETLFYIGPKNKIFRLKKTDDKFELNWIGYKRLYIPYETLSLDKMNICKEIREKYDKDTILYMIMDAVRQDEIITMMYYFSGIELSLYKLKNIRDSFEFDDGNFLYIKDGNLLSTDNIKDKEWLFENGIEVMTHHPYVREEKRKYAEYDNCFYINSKEHYHEEIIKKMIELGGQMKYPLNVEGMNNFIYYLDEYDGITVTDDKETIKELKERYDEYEMDYKNSEQEDIFEVKDSDIAIMNNLSDSVCPSDDSFDDKCTDEKPYHEFNEKWDLLKNTYGNKVIIKYIKEYENNILNLFEYLGSFKIYPANPMEDEYWMMDQQRYITYKSYKDLCELDNCNDYVIIDIRDFLYYGNRDLLHVEKINKNFYIKGSSEHMQEIKTGLRSLGFYDVDDIVCYDGVYVYVTYENGNAIINFTKDESVIYMLNNFYEEMYVEPKEKNYVIAIEGVNDELFSPKRFYTESEALFFLNKEHDGLRCVVVNDVICPLVIKKLI